MYQMPYGGGGYPPYQQGSFPPQGGFPSGGFPPPGGPGFGVPPPGGFPPPGSPGFGAPAGGFPPASYGTTNDDDDEYEYITDDDGDYIEDEDGTILTIGEAQNRGLIEPAGEGERGIGKKLLIGGAVLGGIWILRKQLKKKKKVKKQKGNQSTVSYNKPQQNIYGQAPPQNIYGQPQHGYGQAPPPPQGIYGQPAQYPPFKRDVPGPGFGGPGFGGW